MTKRKTAIITVEAHIESGYVSAGDELVNWIEYVNEALKAYQDGKAPMRYANFKVIDARLCKPT